MAGHSKWAQIKRQKGIEDNKRASVFTKIARMITVAVKDSGNGDPDTNFKLRLAIEKAKSVNMPKINIERAIDVGLGKGSGGVVEEGLYEGYAPGGKVSILVETVSDNNQRTYSEIRNIFDKSGGRLVQPGAVSYQFELLGIVKIDSKNQDLILEIMDINGVVDVSEEEGVIIIYTDLSFLNDVRHNLELKKLEIDEIYKGYKPRVSIEVTDSEIEILSAFVEKLSNHDDVVRVYTLVD